MVNTTDQWNNDLGDEEPISMCMMSDSDFEREEDEEQPEEND